MNNTLDQVRLIQFLKRLGQCFRRYGRLYLVGGSSLLLLGAKEVTLDIDINFEVDSAYHSEFVQCLRRVGREMGLAWEVASPDQFMALPKGYQQRHIYIDRYELIEVFHFDLYSTALSKISRGNQKDFEDVIHMLESGIVEWAKLEQDYQEVLPLLEQQLFKADPDVFMDNFTILRQRYTP